MDEKNLIEDMFLTFDEKRECEWLDSKGFRLEIVSCFKCGREYEEVLHEVRYEESLENDIFICENCSLH